MSSTTSGTRRRRAAARKRFSPGADARVENSFELLERRRIAEHPPSERRAIDPARPGCRTERLCHLIDRRATRSEQRMNRGIGIEDRNAKPPERPGRLGLAHADGTGQAEDDHDAALWCQSASTNALSSGVTSGAIPNHASNPGRAWWSNMPSPSTEVRSRALAAASRGVSTGS